MNSALTIFSLPVASNPGKSPYRIFCQVSDYRVNQALPILICSPASPPCLDPGLPTHITRHNTVLEVCSSKMSSTNCPRLRREVPPILKPSCESSRTRHGILCACRPCFTTRLARFFRAVRFNRRRSGMGRLGTALLPIFLDTNAEIGASVDRVGTQVRFSTHLSG
jgi:hypothetical protein